MAVLRDRFWLALAAALLVACGEGEGGDGGPDTAADPDLLDDASDTASDPDPDAEGDPEPDAEEDSESLPDADADAAPDAEADIDADAACEEPVPDCSACPCNLPGATPVLPETLNVNTWTEEELDATWRYNARTHYAERFREAPFSDRADTRTPGLFVSWQERAAERLYWALRMDAASWPDTPLRPRVINEQDFDGYTRQTVDWILEPGQRLPAYLYIPDDLDGPSPAVIIWHGHGPGGREQVAGNEPYTEESNYHHAAARRMAEAGYVVLAPEIRSFGSTGSDREHTHIVNMLEAYGLVSIGVFLADAGRAIDYLETLPYVDTNRIGVGGTSLGAEVTLLQAATDPRVRVAVVQGYLASVRGTHLNSGHCACQYIPMMGRTMDFGDWAALAAPTPLRFVMGETDGAFPRSEAEPEFDRAAVGYELLGAGEDIDLYYHSGGHEWIQEAALEWFDRYLRADE